jgi:hypothetical protein
MTRTAYARELCGELVGPFGVHARPLDEDEVGSAEEIDTRSEEDGLNEKAERETGQDEEVSSEFERNGDDQHVHEVKGVAHATGEGDPGNTENLA